ncbi:RpiR family transcriptional regulator [Paraclostridium bifermentans]|uniref:MurR/RpiR family transcriptional regulator n=1 Tax=Paraclostridium bifermentans TaxID=1490 RepID=UPI0021C3273D|nr:MurR/RpiR family transcriptional regulator [Paraclostridium bifermentans]GKZ02035.1 RpiR family transcriptional regulator [Paraclostridium bifermentans]GKZ07346.1 RpiR family transcriptional regulator [Paraclostridium bifermentans]GKZ11067.1 RpiR family transcriptional regulator [Paraclostridium bifermentans]
MEFYERVKKHEHKFTDTEDMIIEYMISNKEEVVKLSIQSLSDKFFTVPNTIVRLCKKMEYDGFSQLKNNLKNELKSKNKDLYSGFESNILKTLELIDYEKIKKVVDIIHKSRGIIVYGIGQNSHLCEIFVKELRTAHENTNYYNQRDETLYNIEKLGEQDMFFALSQRGKTKDVIEAAKLAKSKGCKVVALTHICENELQEIADVSLYCYSTSKKINGYDISDKVPAMIIMRAIIEKYWLK